MRVSSGMADHVLASCLLVTAEQSNQQPPHVVCCDSLTKDSEGEDQPPPDVGGYDHVVCYDSFLSPPSWRGRHSKPAPPDRLSERLKFTTKFTLRGCCSQTAHGADRHHANRESLQRANGDFVGGEKDVDGGVDREAGTEFESSAAAIRYCIEKSITQVCLVPIWADGKEGAPMYPFAKEGNGSSRKENTGVADASIE